VFYFRIIKYFLKVPQWAAFSSGHLPPGGSEPSLQSGFVRAHEELSRTRPTGPRLREPKNIFKDFLHNSEEKFNKSFTIFIYKMPKLSSLKYNKTTV